MQLALAHPGQTKDPGKRRAGICDRGTCDGQRLKQNKEKKKSSRAQVEDHCRLAGCLIVAQAHRPPHSVHSLQKAGRSNGGVYHLTSIGPRRKASPGLRSSPAQKHLIVFFGSGTGPQWSGAGRMAAIACSRQPDRALEWDTPRPVFCVANSQGSREAADPAAAVRIELSEGASEDVLLFGAGPHHNSTTTPKCSRSGSSPSLNGTTPQLIVSPSTMPRPKIPVCCSLRSKGLSGPHSRDEPGIRGLS